MNDLFRLGKGCECKFPYFGASTETMHSNNCKNCDHLLSETYQFCPSCGQTAHIHKFSIGHLLHEFFHAFTHADKGILLLLKGLATKPGIVLKEYIIEGKRKKYFNPFTFLLIVLGFSVLMNSLVHPFVTEVKPDPKIMAQFKTPQKQQIYIKMLKKQAAMNDFFEKKSNWVTMFSIPVISLVFWLMFRKRGVAYAEHFVAYIMLIGFIILLTTLALTPLMSLVKGTKYYFLIVLGNLILQLVYFSWGYKDFLNLQSTSQILRGTLTSFLGILLWMFVSMLGVAIYLIFF